ncbi:MAG: hypothetical protein ACYDBQ_01590 [Thermoplasmatota archaeon]
MRLLLVIAALAVPLHDVAGPLHYLEPYARGSLAPYVMEAAAAAGLNVSTWPPSSPVLAFVPPPAPQGGLATLRAAHARAVAGLPPVDANGTPLAADLLGSFRGGQFGLPDLLNDDAWTILTLSALKSDDPRIHVAARHLAENGTGGWSWSRGGPPEVDMTGMVATALAAAHESIPGGVAAYLVAHQHTGGGFDEAGGNPNCDSTVWALRGLAAVGRPNPAGWRYLDSLRQADGGYAYDLPPSNALCTAEVATLFADANAGRIAAPSESSSAVPLVACLAVLLAAVVVRRP